jgi:hypothetical protein
VVKRFIVIYKILQDVYALLRLCNAEAVSKLYYPDKKIFIRVRPKMFTRQVIAFEKI